MEVDRLADGLWRWTAPSAEPAAGRTNRPGVAASLYHEAGASIVLIDPLIPAGPDGERFWLHLDRDVERVGAAPVVISTLPTDSRSADAIRTRYPGAQTLAVHEAAGCTTDGLLEDHQRLPGGLCVLLPAAPSAARRALIHCACHRLLWASDLLVNDGRGGLTAAPPEWFDTDAERDWLVTALPPLLQRIAALDIDLAVPAHGAVTRLKRPDSR